MTDVDCSELHVAMETYRIWALHSAKIAKVCIRTWVKAIFAGKLFGRTKSCHQPFVHCRVHDARSAISKQTNNASEQLSKCKSVNSSDVSKQTTGSYCLWFVVFSRQHFFNQVYKDDTPKLIIFFHPNVWKSQYKLLIANGNSFPLDEDIVPLHKVFH